MAKTIEQGRRTYRGSCHCGAVTFEVNIDLSNGASRCNCTICTKSASIGYSDKPENFKLLSGQDNLLVYEFGMKVGKRHTCKTCGIFCFGSGHIPELGGDFVSINCNTLEDVEIKDLDVVYWDGRHNNWHAGPRKEPWPIFAPPSA